MSNLAGTEQAHQRAVAAVVLDADDARERSRRDDLRDTERETEHAEEVGETFAAGAAIRVGEALIRFRDLSWRRSDRSRPCALRTLGRNVRCFHENSAR